MDQLNTTMIREERTLVTPEATPSVLIQQGIEAADQASTHIDDRTAREIARQFCSSEDSALGSFVACGAIWNDNDELFTELYADWQNHTPEQQEWAEALRKYCAARDDELPVSHWCEERADTPSGVHPEIWVDSLTDYEAGIGHGMWISAHQEPEAILAQIKWILRTSPTARASGSPAEGWLITETSGFCGYNVREQASIETVSLVAQRIATHGPAYAAWVELVGSPQHEAARSEIFQEHYQGTWDSVTEYVDHVLREDGTHDRLERAIESLPDDVRRRVRIDTAGLARDWQLSDMIVSTTSRGHVHVFTATSSRC